MLIIFRKILLILIILTSIGITQALSNIDSECIKLNFENTPLFKKKKLELIDIKINDNRDWQVNNIRILTNNSHVIPEKFKLRFKAEIKVFFTDNTSCTLRAKVRTQGDLKDHIFYKNGKVFQSLDVSLNDGHINNITKFKLFLNGTRGKEEDEIFMTELLREFGFLAPRTEIVNVKINDHKIKMLFQEKISKEFLEFNRRREGPILEGDEKYMMNFISKVKNNPGVDWEEIFRLSDLSSKIQLSKQTNSKWSIKNQTFTEISFDALNKLNFVYLVYLNNYKDKKNNYSFLNYNLDNNLLAQNNFKNLNKLNVYNNLLLAANGKHGLYVHNRKFYWNSIENYFEPIYYDGEFNLEKKIKNLNFPLSLDYGQSINATIDLVNSLDKKKILQNINSKNLILSEKKLNKKITNLNENLLLIKKLFNEKSKVDLFYNLEGYKSKDLFNNYLENLKKQKIKFKFAVYDHLKNLNYSDIQICENNIENCDQNLPLDLNMKRDLIEGKLRIDGFDYQFIKSENNAPLKYESLSLNDNNFIDVIFIYNSGIVYNYDKENKNFKINQINSEGRGFFLGGKIKNINIEFNGKENQYLNKKIVKYDRKNLTGCLSFVKNMFINTNIIVKYSNCEDGINIISSKGYIDRIDSKNSVLDGIDLDFSDLFVNNVKINDAGNDCVDFSSGNYEVKSFKLLNCSDKGISVGEKTIAKIENVEIKNADIGIASKDSSEVYINQSKILNTNDCLATYKKKQEFDGGFLKIISSQCKNFKRYKFEDEFSKINISKEL